MLRIGGSLTGFERQLLDALAGAQAKAAVSTLRLATGKRINRAADDPAGLMRLASLEREQLAVQAAMARVDAAANVGATLQLNVESVRTQLNTIRTSLLLDENQTLSSAERTAQQAIIDAALGQVNTIATATVGGRRMLDGSAGYDVSGQNLAQVKDIDVHSVRQTTLSGTVTTAATQGTLTYTGLLSRTTSSATFTLTGNLGSVSISVSASELLTSVATKINNVSHKTGITANASGSTLTISTVDYGTEATLARTVTSGTFNVTGGNGDGTAQGTNAVVTLNSQAASEQGNRVTFAQNGLHVELELVAGYTGAISTMTFSEGTTAKFALGPGTDPTTLALGSLLTSDLGRESGLLSDLATGGSVSGLGANTPLAIRIVDEALDQLDIIEGQINGFTDTIVETSAALLEDWDVQLAAAIESENGINEEEESLIETTQNNLAANAIAALSILQQQQQSMLAILQQIAGLD